MGQAKRRLLPQLAPWTPFVRGTIPPLSETDVKEMAKALNITEAEARFGLDEVNFDEIWLNSRYQVNIRRKGGIVWLSIKRIDKMPPGPERFRDFQRIKNELVGPENEGCEIYPAESRMVDTSNQYHLWVLEDPNMKFPFGFGTRAIVTESAMNAKQQPFEEAPHVV